MKPISVDLRKRIVAARVEDGQSMGQIAEHFRIPKGTVQNILERYRDRGDVAPKAASGGRPPKLTARHLASLEREVLRRPDATLEELRDGSGAPVSIVAVHKALKKLGFTRKKNCYTRASSDVPM